MIIHRAAGAKRGVAGRKGFAAAIAAAWIFAATAVAGTPQVPVSVYARAASLLNSNARLLVYPAVDHATWLDDGHFWYIVRNAHGTYYRIMDAATGKVETDFSRVALAAALASASGMKVAPSKLILFRMAFLSDGRLKVTWHGTRYACRLSPATGKTAPVGTCEKLADTVAHKRGEQTGLAVVSPNGKYAVFVRDWNLWLRNLKTGAERPLTTDGVENDGYATGNAGWVHNNGAIVRWSPDSTKVATFRQDQRTVGNMYTIQTHVGHPILHNWKYALPGDEHVFMIQPVVIDIQTNKMVRLKMKPEQRLSTLCDTLACNQHKPGIWSDVKWAPDSETLALVTTSRNRQHEWFRVANADTGEVRTDFEFTAKDYYESGHGMVNWQYLPKTQQAIWPTVQNNWLNLYLYDLRTGKQIRPITTGKGNVDEVRYFNRKTHTLWFVGNDRTPGINPYFKQLFKVNIDTGKTTLLTPEPADHDILSMSPDGKYFLDRYSTVQQPPLTVLRASRDGHIIAVVSKSDAHRLKAIGWVPPEVIKVKARDGKTTLYGLMFKPTNFNPHKKYPIIDYIYPGPQSGSVSAFDFNSALSDHQALAELGFIVVAIDGMGTPWRSASFHKSWYGDMGDDTLPDQVAAIKELAKRHPWIDIDRVGIWGHSGGGSATANAMLSYPNFFKVGWAESGNYDNRNYENDWGEKYEGLLVKRKDGTTNYKNQAIELKAGNLKGHLMLVDGAIDDNVPHSNTFLLVNALVKANKNFDMLILPDERHGYLGDEPYVIRRRWDYFVRYLMGATPPQE